ncbi:MAG: hypothetical protein FJ361_09110, partial [Gemmatimonadetes bacterium]|nr:hypothetical protein [Gemmatimonadota bacterium]
MSISQSAVMIAPVAFVEESAAEAEPRVIVAVGVGWVETTQRPVLGDGLIEREAMRVFAETTAEDIGYLMAWHEGRDGEFVQAALTDGRMFRIEIHDDSTDPGNCLAVNGVRPGDVS